MKKIVGAVVALVVLAALVVPYVLGGQVRSQYEQRVTQLSDSADVDMRIVSYQRGWLSSQARIRVGEGKQAFEMDSDIHHAILPGFDFAHIVTTLSRDQVPKLASLFDGPILTFDTHIGMDKQASTQITSPSATGVLHPNDNTVHIEWSGMNGQIDTTDERSTLTLAAQNLHAFDGEDDARMQNLQIDATVEPDQRYDDPMLRSTMGHNEGSIRVGNISITPENQQMLSFGVEFQSTSEEDEDTLGYSAGLKLNDIVFKDTDSAEKLDLDINSAALMFDAKGFKRDAVAGLLRAVRDMDDAPTNADGTPQVDPELKARLENHLSSLFADNAHVRLRIPGIETSQGSLGTGLTLGMSQRLAGDQNLPLPQRLAERLTARATAFIDRSLLVFFLKQNPGSQGAVEAINGGLDSDLITLNDGRLKSSAYYSDGALQINGQQVPPQLMQMFMMAFAKGAAQAGN